jgi:hypothetical protein
MRPPVQSEVSRFRHKVKSTIGNSDVQDLCVYVLVSAITYQFSRYYVAGDQVGYNDAYRAVRGIGPLTAFELYQDFISTLEFVHYSIVYIASNLLIDKNLLFSLINGAFSVFIVRSLRDFNVNIIVSLIFVFTNYYVYVCYFAAERLKLALLFLLVGAYLARGVLSRTLCLTAAITSHVSVIILISGAAMKRILANLNGWRQSSNWMLLELLIFLSSLAFFYIFFGEYILWKLHQYIFYHKFSWGSLVPLVLYISASLYYTKNKGDVVVDFIPAVIAFALLGGSRVNMFAYMIFLKHGLQYNRGVNWGVAVTSVYFAAKSVSFVKSVLETGQGF